MIELDVKKILTLYLRQYWSVTRQTDTSPTQYLNYTWKFLFCCLFPLQPTLDAFNLEITKIITLSNLQWVKTSMEEFLNDYYDPTLRRIYFGNLFSFQDSYLGSEDDDTLPYFYLGSEEDNTAPYNYLSSEQQNDDSSDALVLYIPNDIFTNQIQMTSLIKDVNLIKPISIYVNLKSII
jgi:hypothetical protein